jgi:hypothetical protein
VGETLLVMSHDLTSSKKIDAKQIVTSKQITYTKMINDSSAARWIKAKKSLVPTIIVPWQLWHKFLLFVQNVEILKKLLLV